MKSLSHWMLIPTHSSIIKVFQTKGRIQKKKAPGASKNDASSEVYLETLNRGPPDLTLQLHQNEIFLLFIYYWACITNPFMAWSVNVSMSWFRICCAIVFVIIDIETSQLQGQATITTTRRYLKWIIKLCIMERWGCKWFTKTKLYSLHPQ